VRELSDLNVVIDKLNVVVPVLEASSVTKQGFDLLYQLLSMLPARLALHTTSTILWLLDVTASRDAEAACTTPNAEETPVATPPILKTLFSGVP
jgi:hypothetical protein